MPDYFGATDTLGPSQELSVGKTLVSSGQIFALGFFSPEKSNRSYVGIWYKRISPRTVTWVANRGIPLSNRDNSASLIIGSDGNLRLLDGKQNIVWSTNISVPSNNSVAVLSDAGDLIIKETLLGSILWVSSWYPSNVFLPNMLVGVNTRTDKKRFLRSWASVDDPSPGNFVGGLMPPVPVQLFIWKGSSIYWRSGPWNGVRFIGLLSTYADSINNWSIQQNNQDGTFYITFSPYDKSAVTMMVLSPVGLLRILRWDQNGNWNVTWEQPANPCDIYGTCGSFGVCNFNKSPMCECLKGFVPKLDEEWSNGHWKGGCVRKTKLLCQRNESDKLTSDKDKQDGFLGFDKMKLPDGYQYLDSENNAQDCRKWCLDNCLCSAYAYPDGIGCLIWAGGDLIDMQRFSFSGAELFVRLSHSELDESRLRGILIISLTSTAIIVIVSLMFCLWRRKGRQKSKQQPSWDENEETGRQSLNKVDESPLPAMDYNQIAAATSNFNKTNKLGEGGFGAVYKGKLQDGLEIAVKRLSSHSGQGVQELKNEILLISRLQHKNLVRILGCCIGAEEKLLVYEYMENRSLDTFLVDPRKKQLLNWTLRFNIIQGVARGLLYLHRDSRLRIIHRDLKASNILLDIDMNPKISDFGLARTFMATQDLANTQRVAGTYGYMSPEYAMRGIFSEKSDVFSFGVLVLELISGRKVSSFLCEEEEISLLGLAWRHWNEGRGLEFMDEALIPSYSADDFLRCLLVGLLCVQDSPAERPTMETVVLMLSSERECPQPQQPRYTPPSLSKYDYLHSDGGDGLTTNEFTTSLAEGR